MDDIERRDAALSVLHRYRQGNAGLAEDALAELTAIFVPSRIIEDRDDTLRSWNHRVIRHRDPTGDGVSYCIHECHYDKRGDAIPTSWTENPVDVSSETRSGLFWVLAVMTEAVAKPVLEIRDRKLVELEPAQELPRTAKEEL